MGGSGMARLRLNEGSPGKLIVKPGMAGSDGSAGIGMPGIAKLRLSSGNAQLVAMATFYGPT